jgi:hypothetical protein
MVEAEKTAIARQPLVKYVPAVTDNLDNGFGATAYPW